LAKFHGNILSLSENVAEGLGCYFLTRTVCCTVSEMWRIGPIFAIHGERSLFNAPIRGELLNSE